MPTSLNPFARLPNGKEVWAWGMVDLANQSFQLLINTLLFSLFVRNVVVGDPARGASVWSKMAGASLLLVVLLSPILGALADQRAWKRELLLATGFLCALLTCLLAIIAPGQIWLAAVLYIAAAVACGLGENFLASFLPEISTQQNVGFVSALGWTMSYVGALLLLGVTAAAVFLLGWDTPAQMKPIFIFAGLWFAVGILPAMLFLKEKAQPQPSNGIGLISGTFRRLLSSARQARRFRQLARFLAVFFIYGMSTQVVIYFLGVIGDSMNFQMRELILFALVIAATAGIASAFTAKFQDRLGHKRTISIFLSAWVLATAAMALTRAFNAPVSLFWLMSGVIGTALGGVGTASRALVGAFTPADRAAEFFGLWGMAYKLAGVVGVITFGVVVKTFATISNPDRGMTIGLFMLCAVFAIGLVLLQFIDEKEGRAAVDNTNVKPANLT
jgi:MFS transporter, UMF1 family